MSQALQVEIPKDQTLKEQQFVVFVLADQKYGVEVAQVREIIMVPEITKIPCAPDFVEGMINLRGQVTTILDLRKRFGLQLKDDDDISRIIIIEREGASVGMAIDRVTEVMRLSRSSIEETPDIISNNELSYIKGVGKLSDGTLLIIIDLEGILSSEEMEVIKGVY